MGASGSTLWVVDGMLLIFYNCGVIYSVTLSVIKSVLRWLYMAKAPIRVSEHFVVKARDGSEAEVIYDPPLLAESQNIRVELRKEKKNFMM